jgi:hypothetical protein|tara:strand:+ start:114 stop:242 length:129 start_codon:yes stop_codon:yes gene_type:complete
MHKQQKKQLYEYTNTHKKPTTDGLGNTRVNERCDGIREAGER